MHTGTPGDNKSLTADEFFELWEKGNALVEEPCGKASRSECAADANARRELFKKVKTDMVMRIYGVSPEKARKIIASAAMSATTNH